MLKSCKYCMRIHDSKYDCGKKPKRTKKRGENEKFRSSIVWQRKVNEIRERDLNLCQVCFRKLYDTSDQFTYDNIEVHHAISLERNFNKRLDNDNLLCVCGHHHEMAERGEIPREVILRIINEQESHSSN